MSHQGEGLVLLFSFVWLWFFVGFVLVVFWLLMLFCGLVCLVVFRNLPFIRNCLRLVSVLPFSLVKNVCCLAAVLDQLFSYLV